MALRRAIGVPFIPDHVVLITEHQRSLTKRDVSLARALPVTSVASTQALPARLTQDCSRPDFLAASPTPSLRSPCEQPAVEPAIRSRVRDGRHVWVT